MGDYLNDKKAIICVNVASKWGITSRDYPALVKIHTELEQEGLQILGFPCNQFKEQEPGTAEEILQLARGKYGVTFPLFEKIEVNGENTHEVYKFLRLNAPELNQGSK